MDDGAAPSIEIKASEFGGWVACLRRGGREIWFAGGPGIGRIGYELANEDVANAAIALERGRLVPDRHAEFEEVVQNGWLGERSKVISEDVNDVPEIKTISVFLDGELMGHLVEVHEGENVWLDQSVSEEIEEARELARELSDTDNPAPSGGFKP